MNQDLAARVVSACAGAGYTLGTCESLTGGGVAAALTSVAGSSAVFRGGLVTYASDLKVALAHVDAGLVATNGVLNEPTACQMATGAREVLRCDLAVACTGVAGPGAQDGVAAGHVWIAVAGPRGVEGRGLELAGDRAAVRRGTVRACLELVVESLGGWGEKVG